MITTVLFDLDGVIRHFDEDPGFERRWGLDEGQIARVAFASPLLDQVTTGRISRAEWIARIGQHTGTAAAEEWGRTSFRIDAEMIALVDELSAIGIRRAILTNGTDTIPDEIEQCGLGPHFDRVFNSAEIGIAKPDRRAFRHVADELGVPPSQVFFTDDSPSKTRGAAELGMTVHVFTGIRPLREALRDAGVLAQPPRPAPPTRARRG